ncbi:MAG: endo alpha-1,4 polygalactosaminidase [Myxococcales bacterium]|nr:endo alpha-1,4 polygalactosaminidase [Myxococcales bacterium]MBK7196370.1 endo alpha-1,4 polygalactosaminidase [Myxococcales bacterium]MBP6847022.1 endo alpha-1,4 polygalactosaminidase [Kofleriaceae bacterium]
MSPPRLALVLAMSLGCGAGGAGHDASVDGSGPGGDGGGGGGDGGGALVLPPANGGLDYQLGGAYAPPAGVTIVSRDREAAPAAGLYNICYVNGFQVQPGEASWWLANHGDLILRDAGGQPVIDPDWNEMLIDTSTAAKRTAVAAIVGDWIRGCAQAGFDAVEIDNLDTFSRSGGRLSEANNVAQMRLFADASHGAGMAIAQKNSAEIVGRKADMGTDFVVSEECNRYGECDVYAAAYGDHVLMIEYRTPDYDTGCTAYGGRFSIVRRDLNLVPQGAAGYVFDGC